MNKHQNQIHQGYPCQLVHRVKERPILFSGPMVRAILDGQKTQTRRVVKFPKSYSWRKGTGVIALQGDPIPCPYGVPGDRLWVRETFCDWEEKRVKYRADFSDGKREPFGGKRVYRWRPSIHMERWASRITLEITAVRVERMQDGGDRDFWGEEKWADNHWVWVIEFRMVQP